MITFAQRSRHALSVGLRCIRRIKTRIAEQAHRPARLLSGAPGADRGSLIRRLPPMREAPVHAAQRRGVGPAERLAWAGNALGGLATGLRRPTCVQFDSRGFSCPVPCWRLPAYLRQPSFIHVSFSRRMLGKEAGSGSHRVVPLSAAHHQGPWSKELRYVLVPGFCFWRHGDAWRPPGLQGINAATSKTWGDGLRLPLPYLHRIVV